MRMKCTKAMVYNGRRFKAGQEFEAASPNDARVLTGIKKAERVKPSAQPAWQPVAEEARRKRIYTRRDLVAEEPRTVLLVPVAEVSEPAKE